MYNNIQIYLSLKGGRNVSRPKDISFFSDSNTYLYTYNTSILYLVERERSARFHKGERQYQRP